MARNERQLEQLSAYLDGELSDAERAAVDAWIKEDEHARILLDELRKTTSMIAGLPRERAPERMADDVAELIERSALLGESPAPMPMESRKGSGWRRGLALAASIALVVTAGWYMWPGMKGLVNQEAEVMTLAEAPEATEKKSASREMKGVPASETQGTPDADVVLAEKESPEDAVVALATRDENESSPHRAGERRVADWADWGEGTSTGAKLEVPSLGAAADSQNEAADTEERMQEGPRMPPLARGDGRGRTLKAAEETNEEAGGRGAATNLVLTNAAIRGLNSSNAGNTLVVETDPATQQEIVSYLNTFVADNNIPSASGNTFSEPIPPTQKFYVDTGNALADESGNWQTPRHADAREVCVVFNAPAKEVEELLTNVDRIRSQNRAQMNWTANSLSLGGDDVQAAMALLRTGAVGEETGKTPLAFGDGSSDNILSGATTETLADDEKGEEATPPATGESAKDKDESSEDEAVPAPPPAPGREKARPADWGARGRGAEPRAAVRRAAEPSPASETPPGADPERESRIARHPPSTSQPGPGKGGDRGRVFAASQPAEDGVSPFIQIAMIFRTLPDIPTTTAPEAGHEVPENSPEKPSESRVRSRSSPTSQPVSPGAPRG